MTGGFPTPNEKTMIRIITVGSGSDGNCYIIECTTEAGFVERLIIEAGVPFKRLQKALKFDLSGIPGCCITHNHGDHAGYAKQYAEKHIVMYSTIGTFKAIGLPDNTRQISMAKKVPYGVGKFKVLAFETEHDAAEPCGFLIDCPDRNRIVFATDTCYLKYKFQGVTIWMIECNYDERLLQANIKTGLVHHSVGERIRKSHMSIAQCIATLRANDLAQTKGIILIHLSSQNSKADFFAQQVEQSTGKMTYIAKSGTKTTFF